MAATQLFYSGTDEQLIMDCTGHHSIDGIRAYPYRNTKVVALLWHPCDKVVAIKLSLGCHYLAKTL